MTIVIMEDTKKALQKLLKDGHGDLHDIISVVVEHSLPKEEISKLMTILGLAHKANKVIKEAETY